MPTPTSRILPGILLPLAALWLGMAPSTLDYRVQDLINQALAPAASEQVVIVAIDEKSLAQLGRWPWPRELLAEAVSKLGHARAVGLNLLLAEHSEHPESDQALARAIAQNGKVYLPAFPEPDGPTLRPTLPLPMLAHAARGVGVSDFPPESNGEIRRTYLASGPGDTRLPSFAALVAGQKIAGTTGTGLGDWGRSLPRLLPYLDSDTRFTTIPMVELLASPQPDPRLQDKTVFVGVTAAGSGDEHFTAIQRSQAKSSGVFINAALAQGLQQNRLATPLAPGWRTSLLLALALGWQLLAHRCKSLHPIRQAALFVGGMLLGDTLLYQLLHIELGTATLGLLILMAATSNFFLLQSHFKKLAFTDKLTGLANRHHFDERIVLALQHSQLEQQALALLVLDVDHFKRYNDHYGHAAGDDILRQIAQVIASMVRTPQDTVARIGGEEFALLLPNTTQQQAEAIATELRYRLLSRQIPHHSSPLGRVSCSVGIYADTPEQDATVRSIFEQADQALYQAKRNGRDQACVADGLLATRI